MLYVVKLEKHDQGCNHYVTSGSNLEEVNKLAEELKVNLNMDKVVSIINAEDFIKSEGILELCTF